MDRRADFVPKIWETKKKSSRIEEPILSQKLGEDQTRKRKKRSLWTDN